MVKRLRGEADEQRMEDDISSIPWFNLEELELQEALKAKAWRLKLPFQG